MKCPECKAECWREEVDVGVGLVTSPWACSDCGWSEEDGFPMLKEDWQRWLDEGWEVGVAE